MRISLARVLAGLSEEEAHAAYNALAQWADNERNGLEEDAPYTEDDQRVHDKREREVSVVEKIVGRLDTEFCKLAEAG